MSALMATMLFQCAKVIAIDVSADIEALLLSATHAIDASTSDPINEIQALTDGLGGLCRGGVWAVKVIEQAFASIRRGGGLCVFATHRKGNIISIDLYELICGKQIRGSWGGSSNPDRDIPMFSKLYLEGKLPLEKLITKRYHLDDINQALDDLEHRRVGRPLIEIDTTIG